MTSLRRLLTPAIFQAAVRRRWQRYMGRLYYVEGRAKGSSQPLSMVILCTQRGMGSYFQRLFFETSTMQDLGPTWIPQAKRKMEHLSYSPDLFISTSPVPGIDSVFKIPKWMPSSIDLRPGLDTLCKKHPRSVGQLRTKYKRHAFTHDQTNDQAAIRHFVKHLHIPWARRTFKDEAELPSMKTILHHLKDGQLLRLYHQGEYIAACAYTLEHNVLQLYKFGVAAMVADPLRRDVIPALYYTLMQIAENQGLDSIHLGSSRPFLSDGVFWHKLHLSARIIPPHWSAGDDIYLKVLKTTAGAEAALSKNPFCILQPGATSCPAAVFGDPNQDEVIGHIKRFAKAGLNPITLYSSTSETRPIKGLPDDSQVLFKPFKECLHPSSS